MEPIDILLDTSILIKIWRGDTELENELRPLSCGIDTTVSLEFLQGVNKNQRTKSDKFLKRFELIPFTPMISFTAIRLIKNMLIRTDCECRIRSLRRPL